jgi:hypothetical protein
MKTRYTAAEFRARQNLPPPGSNAQVISTSKPAIRVSTGPKMRKTEIEYEQILETEFSRGNGYEVRFEVITFRLAGGNYTPDFTIWDKQRLFLVVECKGSYRLGSAGRSHMAFKSAIAAFPHLRFRFAQKSKDGWAVKEFQHEQP